MDVECQFSHITGKLGVLILNCMYNIIDIRDTEVVICMILVLLQRSDGLNFQLNIILYTGSSDNLETQIYFEQTCSFYD
jgi:hypothetical protein